MMTSVVTKAKCVEFAFELIAADLRRVKDVFELPNALNDHPTIDRDFDATQHFIQCS